MERGGVQRGGGGKGDMRVAVSWGERHFLTFFLETFLCILKSCCTQAGRRGKRGAVTTIGEEREKMGGEGEQVEHDLI